MISEARVHELKLQVLRLMKDQAAPNDEGIAAIADVVGIMAALLEGDGLPLDLRMRTFGDRVRESYLSTLGKTRGILVG